jgi:hypothetical protein
MQHYNPPNPDLPGKTSFSTSAQAHQRKGDAVRQKTNCGTFQDKK